MDFSDTWHPHVSSITLFIYNPRDTHSRILLSTNFTDVMRVGGVTSIVFR